MSVKEIRAKNGFDSYFTEVSVRKRFFYIVLVIYVVSVMVVAMLEPFVTPQSCLEPIETSKEFGNSLFRYNPCRYERKGYLLFLTPVECSYSRRLVIAVILGGLIGWERRQADRPGAYHIILDEHISHLRIIQDLHRFIDLYANLFSWYSNHVFSIFGILPLYDQLCFCFS